MPYATPADLLTRFSPDEIAQRAAPEGLRVSAELLRLTIESGDRSGYSSDEIAAADAALQRLLDLGEDADSKIDACVAMHYTLPLPSVPPFLRRMACDFIRYWLYDDELSDESVVARNFKAQEKNLAAICAGTLGLGVQPDPAGNAEGDLPQYRSPCRVFSRETLQDF